MKRILLGLIMMSSMALAAAPMANAAAPQFCGHSYAFQVVGAEPASSSPTNQDVAIEHAQGVGVLTFAPTTCAMTGEMIYMDNDYQSFYGGAQNCPVIRPPSIENVIPCFDGTNHVLAGGVGPGPNGSSTIALIMDFPAAQWGPAAANFGDQALPFVFTVFSTGGGATLIGNSNIPPATAPPLPGFVTPGNFAGCDAGFDPFGCGENAPPGFPSNASVPPIGPVLSFTAQRQGIVPVPTVYGTAPYKGNAAVLCTGFGGDSNDFTGSALATQSGAAGAYGATSGSLTIFASGYAFGSLTFNSNDDVGNTSGVTNYDCNFQQVANQTYADGGANNSANIFDEFFPSSPTPTCPDGDGGLVANANCTANQVPFLCCTGAGMGTCPVNNMQITPIGAAEVNSTVQWGSTDQNSYTIVTAISTPVQFNGQYIPPGLDATCTVLAETPTPGTLTATVSPTTNADTVPPYPVTKASTVTIKNTSEGVCTVGGAVFLASSNAGTGTTGNAGQVCNVALDVPGNVTEGDSGGVSTPTMHANCTCTAAPHLNSSCTSSGVPFGCCSGSKAGTCVAESDTYDLFLATQPANSNFDCTGSGAPHPWCTSAHHGTAACPQLPQASTPVVLTCKN